MTMQLADALPGAEFAEHHLRVIDAAPDRVWEALHQVRWSDLRLTKPLVLIRSLGQARHRDGPLLDGGPVPALTREPPGYVAGGRVARPWEARPTLGPTLGSLEELAAYDRPGWLKYGTDFRLDPLPGGRTRLTTSTLCEPTDEVARRRFAPYWRLIRPFSGVIRHDMLRAVARRAVRS